MDWADDLKLTLKKSAKKGRRAAAALLQSASSSNNTNTNQGASSSTSTILDTEIIVASTSSSSTTGELSSSLDKNNETIDSLTNFDQIGTDHDQPSTDIKKDYLTKTKKIGGWGDDVIKLGRNKSTTNLIEQERFNNSLITKSSVVATSLSDDDIPIIPDLDDIQDELLLNEMVEAPTVSVNRVATYNELNSDLLKQGSFATLEDIDLSILGKCLHSESDINESDEPWTWDKLFIEVSAEIYADNIQNDDIQSQFVH